MNKLIKITSILIIQIMLAGNCAGGDVASRQPDFEQSCLSPHINLDSSAFKNRYLYEAALLRLKATGCNEAEAARNLGISRMQLRRLIPQEIRDSLRINEKKAKRRKFIQILRKYCFDDNWAEHAAKELNLEPSGVRDKMIREQVKLSEIRRELQSELELKALQEADGNVGLAVKISGVSKDTLYKYHKKNIKRIKEQKRLEEDQKKIVLLLGTIEEAAGKIGPAAEELGVSRKTLRNWLKKYSWLNFPPIIEEKLKIMSSLIHELETGLKENKSEDIDESRIFYQNSIEDLNMYAQWLKVYQMPLLKEFLPDETERKVEEKLLEISRQLKAVQEKYEQLLKVDGFGEKEKLLTVLNNFYIKQLLLERLRANEWNASKTARDEQIRRLGIKIGKIYKIIDAEYITQQRELYTKLAEEQEVRRIKEALNRFINNSNCLSKAAKYLNNMPKETLKDKMRKYNISLTRMKFDKRRVYPVLRKNKGNIRKSSLDLGMSKDTLRKRFGSYIEILNLEYAYKKKSKDIAAIDAALRETGGNKTKAAMKMKIGEKAFRDRLIQYDFSNISKYELIQYRIMAKLASADELFYQIREKACAVDENDKKSLRRFHRSAHFVLFLITNMLKEADEQMETIEAKMPDLDLKINLRWQTQEKLKNLILNVNGEYDVTDIVLQKRLRHVINGINSFEDKVQKIAELSQAPCLITRASLKKFSSKLIQSAI